MSEQHPSQLSYHESLLEQVSRPHIVDCPKGYEPNKTLIDALNRGDLVSENLAFSAYFDNLRTEDPYYMQQIDRILEKRSQKYPEAVSSMSERKLQFVIPAYREEGNITPLLQLLKEQFNQTGLGEWGITFVFDHAVPYKNAYEVTARKAMEVEIETFLERNPQLEPYIDTISYTRRAETATPILPVGLARKVGNDVIMSERLKSRVSQKPLYLGLMDCDLSDLSGGVVAEILQQLPNNEADKPTIVRVRGSFDRNVVREHPELHPLEMFWEGMTSETARNSHNPFTVGRMSAVPARELAITGGSFAKRLDFPDEDIRHGEQIRWQVPGVSVTEVKGRYETSPRREIDTVRSLLATLQESDGNFTMAMLEYASLIRMYGGWADHTFRNEFGNVDLQGATGNPLEDPELFAKVVTPQLIEVSANARYRFGLFAKFVVDELADNPDAPEITALKQRFLRGEVPSFMNEFHAVDLLRQIEKTDPDRFARILPSLVRADTKARQSIASILTSNHIKFTLEDPESPIYTLEADMLGERTEERDNTPLRAPIRIDPDLSEYMAHIRREIGLPELEKQLKRSERLRIPIL